MHICFATVLVAKMYRKREILECKHYDLKEYKIRPKMSVRNEEPTIKRNFKIIKTSNV